MIDKKTDTAVTLDSLHVGASATITTVGGDGPLRCRLLDMGLIPRTKVTVSRIAPMGDPIEIEIRGYKLSLRKEDACKIGITVSDGAKTVIGRR